MQYIGIFLPLFPPCFFSPPPFFSISFFPFLSLSRFPFFSISLHILLIFQFVIFSSPLFSIISSIIHISPIFAFSTCCFFSLFYHKCVRICLHYIFSMQHRGGCLRHRELRAKFHAGSCRFVETSHWDVSEGNRGYISLPLDRFCV